GRERREEAPDDEERLLRRRRRAGEERRDAGGDPRALRLVAGQRRVDGGAHAVTDVVDAKERAQRAGERRERGAAGRVALGGEYRAPVAEAAGALGEEP